MKTKRWIGFVARRYVSRGRVNSPSPVFSVLGIATGVLALTIIISVMNGFQLGFIESILEISSYHVRIEGLDFSDDAEFIDRLRSVPALSSVLPFTEINVLLRGRHSAPRGALIRGVPPLALELDPGLAAKLEIEEGLFSLDKADDIVLGAELAYHLSAQVGDEINLLSITEALRDEEASRVFRVSGIFRSGFYEYDLGWAFINIDTATELMVPIEPGTPLETGLAEEPTVVAPNRQQAAGRVLGIKLKNRWQDQKALKDIESFITVNNAKDQSGGHLNLPSGVSVRSWRDYNRSFFSALRTEKLMMFILVGLIFIVVGLNIFQSQRRIILERQEEIGLLRALGAPVITVRLIFVLDGFIIGLTGALLGLIPGLLLSFHIQAFFTFLEGVVNIFVILVNSIYGFLGGNAGNEEFAIFSPQIFYIKEIPSRVIPQEALLIFMFGFSSALFAAWFASGKVSATTPTEVLRYE